MNKAVAKVNEGERAVECVESQEWTYGIDNTGTHFTDTASYELVLSDGTTLAFSQTPTSGWSAQLTEWAANIQTAADAAGLLWFSEPRFIDNLNPINIDGTIGGPGGTPSGLPGAPSASVASALFAGGMAWRYVNIQICPGQPVPVRAIRTSSAQGRSVPFDLNTAGAVLGPLNRFYRCVECGKGVDWFLDDAVTPAEAGQIPNCWEPCGTIALLPAPPDRACEFVFDVGCDSGAADPTLQITRRATFCAGEQTALDFFEADPADPTALIEYALIGEFVDCDSGVPVEEPTPDQETEPVGSVLCYTVAETVAPGALLVSQTDGLGATVQWTISPNVVLERDTNGHFYNVAQGQTNDQSGIVTGTLWRNDTVTTPSGFQNSYQGSIGSNITTAPFQNVYVTDTVAGVEHGPYNFTSWQRGGGGGFTVFTADSVTPAEDRFAFIQNTETGLVCRDTKTGDELTPEQADTLRACPVEISNDCLAVEEKNACLTEACYRKPDGLVDTIAVIDTVNVPTSEDIVFTPNESGEIDRIIIQIVNNNPFVPPAPHPGQPFSILVDGQTLDACNSLQDIGPSSGVPLGNVPLARYAVIFKPNTPIQVTAGVPLVISDPNNSTGFFWTAATDDDGDGQVAFSANAAFPQIRLEIAGYQFFSQKTFADGREEIRDEFGTVLAELPGQLDPVPCSQNSILLQILDKLCEISDKLTVVKDEASCIALRGFDYTNLDDIDAGSIVRWRVFEDGNVVGQSQDEPLVQDNGFKSSWYAGLQALVNSSGWTMSVQTDTASDGSGTDDKVVWKFEGPPGSTLQLVRDSGDTLTLTANADGTVDFTFEEGGNNIASDMERPCE